MFNSRNSECSTALLSTLDRSQWWSDNTMPGRTYIHVPRRSDDTVHGVFCRSAGNVRVGWVYGELHWIIDPQP